ncbi:hypothetical protein ACSQ67_007594 [Phaseolus vulgaris]
MTAKNAEKQILSEPHWAFCYTMLDKVSRSFALVIQQLGTDLRNAVALEGELEMADSKASFLQNLCDELYEGKTFQLIDEDVSALLRLLVKLCIPQPILEAA